MNPWQASTIWRCYINNHIHVHNTGRLTYWCLLTRTNFIDNCKCLLQLWNILQQFVYIIFYFFYKNIKKLNNIQTENFKYSFPEFYLALPQMATVSTRLKPSATEMYMCAITFTSKHLYGKNTKDTSLNITITQTVI